MNKGKEDNPPLLETRGLYKSFGHVKALNGVDLKIFEGQVLAIVGDNGAGKTTLIKLLSGAMVPDGGEIIVRSEVFKRLSPSKAIQLGISTVYQDLALVNSLDIVSNIFLGREEISGKFFLNKKKMKKEASKLLDSLQIDIPLLKLPVSYLSGGQRQAIAVSRAINQGGKIIIFDEPTAAMGIRESARILKLIKKLGEKGFAVIVISHNLHQVFEISDRICVLRQGQVVEDFITRNTHPDEIIHVITGSDQYYLKRNGEVPSNF
ncbi:ATP-binding cassette domain-containing protein [Candidatus Contubernalis alkaliaceticus]|uniref:ATP-binding cassette domain-containing protein n=1 Tax=Candidatus Contubernalis alkaliaceticus TaxID=338645 RepID=UPI001F4C1CB5|nr:ATP-binding cassette domain-containing protein [Candidatus Contubernalis alkalaceticus]UNC90862.1 sugar ABC transporter ATP-binding protein [Candidatus Contubernalis alkalaceticus]